MLIRLMLGLLEFKRKNFVEMKDLFEQLSSQQNPETLFITCSDSRIIPNLITKADPGDLFNIRNIGNIIPPYPSEFSETSAIEYSLNALEIKDIIICGHSNCGAMKGLLTPNLEEKLPAVAFWLSHSHSVLKEIESERKTKDHEPSRELEIATKKNIVHQMEHLKSYPLVKEKIGRKQLTVHGWYYELETGRVFIYEPELKEFIQLEAALERARESRKIKIVSGLCMHYLQQIPSEYDRLKEQGDIQSIWEFIKVPAKQQLWKELGGFYTSTEDEEFIAMVESSKYFKLVELEEFQKSISPEVSKTNENKANTFSDISMWLLSGFMDIAGAAVAVVIVVLKAPFVLASSISNSLGVTSILESVGLFSFCTSKSHPKISEESMQYLSKT